MNTFSDIVLEWIWIDLDDTIWDFRQNSWNSLELVYHEARLNKAFDSVDDWRNAYLQNNHRLWTLYNAGSITKDFLMMERFRVVLVNAGYSDSDARQLSPQLSDMYLDRLARTDLLVEGARDLLDHLKAKNYKLGIISNGFREVQYRKMQSSNISGYFDAVVLSDDIGVNKPDRRIFDYAINIAGSSASKSLIIGDNPTADIEGALSAGWHAIYFNQNKTNKDPAPAGATEVTSLKAVTDLL